MDARRVGAGAVAALLVGAGFVVTHVLWYRFLEQSPAIDVVGSLVLGVVSMVAYGLLSMYVDLPAWPWSLAAFGAGFLVHLLLTPTFTPFGLAARGVNAVLFVFGIVLALRAVVRPDSYGGQ